MINSKKKWEKSLPKSSELELRDLLATLRHAGEFCSCSEAKSFHERAYSIKVDSRNIQAGDVFVAYKGSSNDSHRYIEQAVKSGAKIIIFEEGQKIALPKTITDNKAMWISVNNGRSAWAHLAAASFKNPQKDLKIVGVTGTNGKTSTVWMTQAIFRKAGVKSLSIGTLGAWMCDDYFKTRHTTPDPDVLFALFANAVKLRLNTVLMEVSSHALEQRKVCPLNFHRAVFTSFSRDHLDYHRTMEDYFNIKWELFAKHLEKSGQAIICDEVYRNLAKGKKCDLKGVKTTLYGKNAEAAAKEGGLVDFCCLKTIAEEKTGSIVEFFDGKTKRQGRVPYLGICALENFTAALLISESILGEKFPEKLWSELPQVPGRLESLKKVLGRSAVVVDYAHTPDALQKALLILRSACEGKLWVVFGCGGDRDRGKRPLMGKISEDFSDRVIVTSDNPRSEDPDTIIQDILRGIEHKQNVYVESDRRAAIALAIKEAGEKDIVLIAGKGHETYQIIGSKIFDFDDRVVADEEMAKT